MNKLRKHKVSHGTYLIEVADANLRILCGSPDDTMKHLIKNGFINNVEQDGVSYQTGPNAILLSDIAIQHGTFCNLAEFPIMHMLYKQGMEIPGHPNNTGQRPLLIGLRKQVEAQLHYIYRGNYGLTSKAEILQTGIPPELADDLMAVKLNFAFGKIHSPHTFLDTLVVEDQAVEIRHDVFIQRKQVNVFQFSYHNERVEVDLNLKDNERYTPPYTLHYNQFQRDYFSVIHAGDGDGWDINRPCFAGTVVFEGKIYLVDMPPNLNYHLAALGIGINEVEGVFHTHCHDDHFAGMTTLLRSGHKVKYYASALVRTSVTKKLTALLPIEENDFSIFFEIHDLELGQWNNINGLEVLPYISPHPVETNIYYFRAYDKQQYRYYAHLTDIVSMSVLAAMQESKHKKISSEFFQAVKQSYSIEADIKKIDIGGGMVHGNADDFIEDRSKQLILSHIARPLTEHEQVIGSNVLFGATDSLITNHVDYAKQAALQFLSSYFKDCTEEQIRGLLNSELLSYSPDSLILQQGQQSPGVHLIVRGNVTVSSTQKTIKQLISGGDLFEEISVLNSKATQYSYQANSYVQILLIPAAVFIEFVNTHQQKQHLTELHQKRTFLQQTGLFNENISYPVLNQLAMLLTERTYQTGDVISRQDSNRLNLLIQGQIKRYMGKQAFEVITPYGIFSEHTEYLSIPGFFSYVALENAQVYQLPCDAIKDIPILRWKLIEFSEQRRSNLFALQHADFPLLEWRDEYSVNILQMDHQHQHLFDLANMVLSLIEANEQRKNIICAVDKMLEYTSFHLAEEEKLLTDYNYFDIDTHLAKHAGLLSQSQKFRISLDDKSTSIDSQDFIHFFSNCLIHHILREDRKYGPFLNQQNIY